MMGRHQGYRNGQMYTVWVSRSAAHRQGPKGSRKGGGAGGLGGSADWVGGAATGMSARYRRFLLAEATPAMT